MVCKPETVKRRSTAWLSWLILALIGCETSQNPEASQWTFRVSSSSMAPALAGPSRLTKCSHCGQPGRIAAETYRAELPTRCWCCGGLCQVAEAIQAGQPIVVQRDLDTRPPRRFDVVAIRSDPGDQPPLVKRLWGLPGEQIELRDGEMWIDDKLLRKSFEELRQVAVPIASFPEDRTSHWQVREGEQWLPIELVTLAQSIHEVQWLSRRPAPVHPEETHPDQWLMPSELVDDTFENQGVRQRLRPVEDYLVSCRLDEPLRGELKIVCRYRQRDIHFIVVGAPPGTTQVTPTFELAAPAEASDRPLCQLPASKRVDLGLCEGRLWIVTDHSRFCIQLPEPASGPARTIFDSAPEKPTALIRIASSAPLHIAKLSLARDLHFDDFKPQDLSPAARLDGYFVMGDNLPVSLDSRHDLGRIPKSRLMGRVLP